MTQPDRPRLRRTLAGLALASGLLASTAYATPDARATAEIDQLLATIGSSGCTFVRSGKEYDGAAARKHLEFKLGFVRSRLASADQFVRDLASTSSTTGEAYHIRCNGNDSTAGSWLEAKLKSIRGQQ